MDRSQNDTHDADEKKGKLRRHRVPAKKKRRDPKKPGWLRTYAPDAAILLGLLLVLLLLIDPGQIVTRPFIGADGDPDYRTAIRFGGSGLLLLILLFPLLNRLRHHINGRQQLWATHCPQCDQPNLKRTRRQWHDHWLNRLGIPARRYICPDCRWTGARVDQHHL